MDADFPRGASDVADFPRGRPEGRKKDDDDGKDSQKSLRPSERKRKHKTETENHLFFPPTKKKRAKSTKYEDGDHSNPALPHGTSLGGGGITEPTHGSKARIIEALSFSRLSEGTKLLGKIREISGEYCVVSLPNMLTGFVRRDATSPPLNTVLPALGTVLAVRIVEIKSVTTRGKVQRRIEVSLQPEILNKTLSLAEVYSGMNIRGRIKSAEDHGCLVSLGPSGLVGFLNYSNVVESKRVGFVSGMVMDFVIVSVDKVRGMIQLGLAKREEVVWEAGRHTLNSLNPGKLVKFGREGYAKNGILVEFGEGVFRGAIECSHLGLDSLGNEKDWREEWKENLTSQHLTARIICVDPLNKIIRLSLAPHILDPVKKTAKLQPLPKVASVVKNAKVIRLDRGVGVLLSTSSSYDNNDNDDDDDEDNSGDESTTPRIGIYLHISNTEAKITAQEFNSKYKLGSKVPSVKIISNTKFTFEHYAEGSTDPEVLNSDALTYSDISAGKTYPATILKISPAMDHMVVSLGKNLTALCTRIHFFDKITDDGLSSYQTNHLKKKLKVGTSTNVKCLMVDAKARKCHVTLKPSLLKDPLPPLRDYTSLEVNQLGLGFVTAVNSKYGIFVTCYDNVHGLVPRKRLALEMGMDDPSDHYKPGDVLKVRVVRITPPAGRSGKFKMEFSLNLVAGKEQEKNDTDTNEGLLDTEDAIILPAKSMKVLKINEKYALINIKHQFLPEGIKTDVDAAIPFVHVANQKFEYVVGKKIPVQGLLYSVGKTPQVSLLDTLISDSKLLPRNKSNLVVGQRIVGLVRNVDERYGAFFEFRNNLKGLMPKAKGGLDFNIGQVAHCKVVEVSKEKLILSKWEGLEVGSTVTFKVKNIKFHRMEGWLRNADVEKKVRLRVHVTNARQFKSKNIERKEEEDGTAASSSTLNLNKCHPFYHLSKGSILNNLVIMSMEEQNGTLYVELTNIPKLTVTDSLTKGSKISGIVSFVSPSHLCLLIHPDLSGIIPGLEISEDLKTLQNLSDKFQLGQTVTGTIMSPPKHGEVTLSLLELQEKSKPKPGQVVLVRLNRKMGVKAGPAVMVDIRGGKIGRCCITELDDRKHWINMPLGREKKEIKNDDSEDKAKAEDQVEKEESHGEYPHDEYLQAIILPKLHKKSNHMIEISLRKSRIQTVDILPEPVPVADDVLSGFVISTNPKGCFVKLSREIEGRVLIKDLCETFVTDPVASFPCGRLVAAKILKVVEEKDQKSRFELDMRESSLLEHKHKLTYEEVEIGSKYKGIVTRVESYGVLVHLHDSDVGGLAHISECSDDYISKNLDKMYDPGDLVKVYVLEKNEEKKRLRFSLKSSHFDDDDDSSSSSGSDESDSEEEGMDVDDDEEDDKGSNLDSDDEDYVKKLKDKMQLDDDAKKSNDNSSDESSDDDEDDSSDSDSSSSDDENENAPQAMDTDVGFDWGGPKPTTDLKGASSNHDSSSEESSSDDDSDSETDTKKKSSTSSRRKKTAEKLRVEQQIYAREHALAEGTLDANPETSSDFERILTSEPNSSETWIKYMAHFLAVADVENARKVAERAIAKIDFREEDEKLNVWTALLTLELKFGSKESLDRVMERASQQNNPKRVYLRVCEMLEKDTEAGENAGSDKVKEARERAEEMYAKMCKKFKSKKTVWIAHLRFLLKVGKHDEAHALLKRSMKSLPSYKHFETVSKFAQLEYEYGSAGRARTLFDALLMNYPKRMDLLFVYVDKEVKLGEVKIARSIFRRVVRPSTSDTKQSKYSDRQMKSLFKKWYRMEEVNGGEDDMEAVKIAARNYVEQSASGK